MSKPGIDYDRVKHAALKLLSQGQSPSVQKVRALLGTGSNTTLAQHLDRWRDEYAHKQVHYLPASLPQELLSAMEILWQTAQEYAAKPLEATKQALDEQQAALSTREQASHAAVETLRSQLASLESQLATTTQDKQRLQTALAVAEERLQQQRDTLTAAQQAACQRLEQANAVNQTLRDDMAALTARLATTQQQLAQQAAQHQHALDNEHARQTQTEQRWASLIDQARQEAKQVRKQHEQVLAEKSKQCEQTQQQLTHAQTECLALRDQLTALRQTNQDVQVEYHATQTALNQLQKRLKQVSVTKHTRMQRRRRVGRQQYRHPNAPKSTPD